jgi:hypothetical protein
VEGASVMVGVGRELVRGSESDSLVGGLLWFSECDKAVGFD